MKRYIVETHLGDFETMAKSARKALSNIRFRLYGRSGYTRTKYWVVKEVRDEQTETATYVRRLCGVVDHALMG